MKRRAFLASALAAAPLRGVGAAEFPIVVRGRSLIFPRDHGSHPDYRNEWWYITGVVRDSSASPSG